MKLPRNQSKLLKSIERVHFQSILNKLSTEAIAYDDDFGMRLPKGFLFSEIILNFEATQEYGEVN